MARARASTWRLAARRRRVGPAAVRQGEDALAHADLVAGLDIDLGDRAGGGGRDGGDRLLVFQFENGLVLGDLVAFFDEQVDDRAGVRAFAQGREF